MLQRRWFWRVAGYVTFLAVWQFISSVLVDDFIVPPPLAIVTEIGDIVASNLLFRHFAATLGTIAVGFGIAFLLGTLMGLAMGRSRWWDGLLGDWVMGTMTTPGLVFALVTAMIFGLGPGGPICAVVITSFSYVAVNVVEGVRAVPKDLVDMARAFDRSRWQIVRHVYLPALGPYLVTAGRYGFSIAWKIATLTEVIVGTAGIGFMMRREFQEFSMAGFLAWVLLFFAFALFLERVVLQRQIKRMFKWRPEVAR
ncbi:MAG: ABC transporter permease subunit [Streptosporangiales bacterium]|nr:ABC transporter permease subunit [Streptosporangiales bacterium]